MPKEFREDGTLAALRRADAKAVIKLRNRGHVRIVDRRAFEEIVGGPVDLQATGSLSRSQREQ